MGIKAIVAEAVKRAQKMAQEEGLIPGKNVAHPDDRTVYELIFVDGDTAIVGLNAGDSPTGRKIRKQFPLKELFNPCTAKKLIDTIIEEEANKSAPPGSGVFVVKL